jgi:uncharacterized repeat protein (TIGR01451 family)
MKSLRNLLCILLMASASWLSAQCPTPPELSMPGTSILTCAITNATLMPESPTPNVTWAWSGPGGFTSSQQSPLVQQPGVYAVTVTEPINGCTASGWVEVVANTAPPGVTTTGGVIPCNSSSITLTASSQTSGATFVWLQGGIQISTGPTFAATTPNTYVVVATSPANGCTSSASAFVGTDPGVPILLIEQNHNLDCINSFVPIYAIVNVPNCTYAWTGPGGVSLGIQSTIVVTAPGNYTCVATSQSGCTASATLGMTQDINPPVFATFSDTIGCNGSQGTIGVVQGISNANDYQWSNGATTRTITSSNPGQYSVTVTGPNGCTATAIATLVYDLTAVSYSVTPVGCTVTNNGAIALATDPNLIVQWANGSTNPNLTNLSLGSYCVTVTNTIVGCTASDCIVVGIAAPIVVTASISQPSCNQNNGSIILSVSGGSAPYTYLWTTAFNGPAAQGLGQGAYTITVTDANGCTNFITAILIDQATSLFNATISVANCSGSIQMNYTGNPTPNLLNYLWSNGATGAVQTNLSPGSYSVQVGVQGCIANLGPFVIPPDGCTQLLQGTLREDANTNCLPEATEQGVNGWVIRATETTTLTEYFSQTDADGYYYMGLPTGTFNVQALPPSAVWVACGTGSLATFSGPDTVTVDISARNLVNCPVLDVQISNGILRRCFNNNNYYVQYQNYGTEPAIDPYAVVTLDPFLSYIGSSVPSINLGGNVYRFNLPNIAPGASGTFDIQVEVSCAATLGQTHCSEAHIYPDTLCFPTNSGWNGALLTTESVCNTDSLRFIIKNVGTAAMSTDLEYIVIEDAIMLRQGQTPPLAPGQSMTVAVPANGSTWRLEVEQEPLSPLAISPTVSVEGCTNTPGVFSTGYLNLFPMLDSMPWLDIDCTPNQGAYDPNDKRGIPEGYGNLHYIEPGTPLDYLIRFQNTGTDTAFTVVVTDTLSGHLDPATFQYLGASHGVRTEIYGEGILRFTFNNIMLPDSNVNEATSHGFVKFKIAHRQGIPLETDIFNEASIYFDFNDPVVTNKTQHRVGRDFVIVRLQEPDAYQAAQVQPNPVTDRILVQWAGYTAYHLQVINAQGRVVQTLDGTGNSASLDANDWQSGVYMIRLVGADNIVRLAKVVKM